MDKSTLELMAVMKDRLSKSYQKKLEGLANSLNKKVEDGLKEAVLSNIMLTNQVNATAHDAAMDVFNSIDWNTVFDKQGVYKLVKESTMEWMPSDEELYLIVEKVFEDKFHLLTTLQEDWNNRLVEEGIQDLKQILGIEEEEDE